jgi:hypothetical protein
MSEIFAPKFLMRFKFLQATQVDHGPMGEGRLVANLTKYVKYVSFPNLALSTSMVLMHVILTKADTDSTFNSYLIP